MSLFAKVLVARTLSIIPEIADRFVVNGFEATAPVSVLVVTALQILDVDVTNPSRTVSNVSLRF